MPTLATKFELALDRKIHEATRCVDLRWTLALQIAKDLPKDIAPDILEALSIAKALVDTASQGLNAKELIANQQKVLDAAFSLANSMTLKESSNKDEGKYLHRGMERQ